MKKALLLIFLSGCSSPKNTVPQSCPMANGVMWSDLKEECVQILEVADFSFVDTSNPITAIYVITSKDKKFAEVFSSSYHGVLQIAGTNMYKNDSQTLQKTDSGWKLTPANYF